MFSVIIPTYNRAAVVGRAIRSVLDQPFAQFELIVVDDGSADETAQVVAGFTDARVRYMYQENAGVSAARNAGAVLARGRFLTFLDSDDEAHPQWLEQLGKLCRQRGIGVVFCGVVEQSFSRTGPHHRVHTPQPSGPLFSSQQVLYLAGSFALERRIFEEIGGYVELLTHGENTELGIRVSEFCALKGVGVTGTEEPLVTYWRHRMMGQSGSCSGKQIRDLRSAEYILKRHDDRLKLTPRVHGLYLSTTGVRAVRAGECWQARRYFLQALQSDPWNLRHAARLALSLLPYVGRRYWTRSDDGDVEETSRS